MPSAYRCALILTQGAHLPRARVSCANCRHRVQHPRSSRAGTFHHRRGDGVLFTLRLSFFLTLSFLSGDAEESNRVLSFSLSTFPRAAARHHQMPYQGKSLWCSAVKSGAKNEEGRDEGGELKGAKWTDLTLAVV